VKLIICSKKKSKKSSVEKKQIRKMSIIYAVVARGKDTTLVEYTTASGTFP